MDLFEYVRSENLKNESPLAARLRPSALDEIEGQEHILSEGKMLYRAIKADKLSSVIFYGPPGTGKTTIAMVIANTTKAGFRQLNATTSGKKDMEEVVKEAKEASGMYGKKTILFIDEIHRFNKAQQDYLLPFVEDGTVILIGATTENPYFEVNGALLSRSLIFELKPLSKDNIKNIILRALSDREKGLGAYGAEIDGAASEFLSEVANGDARAALNAVELAVLTTEPGSDGKIRITLDVAEDCIQRKAARYDRNGDNHYDTISAFIKSMRGSDPDAAVYYLARMLYAGEDIKFIARRIMICAAEDVGLADPMAIVVATNAALAVERVGLPESRIILSEAAVYVATAPKSNASYLAIGDAGRVVENESTPGIPRHLQNVHADSHGEEREQGYLYAHDFPHHYVKQQYLPYELSGREFYKPSGEGYEVKIKEHMKKLKEGAEK